MRHSLPSLAAYAALVLSLVSRTVASWPGKDKPVIATYYPSYNAKLLPAADIPWDLYTHIDYFVAETRPTPTSAMAVDNESNMKEVIAGAKKHGLSISLTVGGWTGSRYFSTNVGSPKNRTAFADTLVRFIKQYGFNGLDIDWEYPALQGIGCNAISVQHDTANLLAFIQLLRQKLGSGYRLSADVSLQGFIGSDGNYLSNLSEFGKVLDYVTVMAYDIFGPGYYAPDYITGPNAPLYDTCAPSYAKGSGSAGVSAWVKAGMPRSKILLGVPSYGYGYETLSNNLVSTHYSPHSHKTSFLYQNASSTTPAGGSTADPAGIDECGNQQGPGGQWLYNELVQRGKLTDSAGKKGGQGYRRYYDECSQTPFLFNNATQSFIAYDDPQSLTAKGTWAKHAQLAGLNVFDATGDTTDNALLKAARSAFL